MTADPFAVVEWEVVVLQGPTCTKNGGGKKLKKIVDEMAAPFGVLHTAQQRERQGQSERERERERERETFSPLCLPLFFILLPRIGD